ncbi:UDP-N-acetylglucosamine 1-carboxyvinyltransferase [Staphylococcus lugdunensis]|jgi:UDP-N-acetylglucosamine 1-carboxyvinyltransferase|uniref:UDP-N-acetylglucosamine 1-carboxyvinyltransferase n=1 Tax=Staphylococcus lugdunensis TaxID=28035 RepID=A0A133QBM5_STALU|nr:MULTISPECIES: UDP-N-acetylglucosamine 1-carboxyvinyltransferase [Staphylococcus]ADC87061.1 UDP-N-acetylglucosamine 1-carboxyvinyltransferase [Staphylococcus lugdunensis HKU09-01]AMG62475.1 UDP-N-acetylglucosamine 1-carboxyvinyltransferase [Staphylococcus lugdunensis]AMG63600.1 UDP-N-acetylglucosamine 1-carboxyvinyltransferase [Staphylococcus lugdunensis]ARB77331.1 UDP-N-acetylglucosamine 1-carboxyvinyltransferase [Staphylococcus lugdunensis]ARJ08843.1 UDP-N-acetylglucosamine 1-carboxyvinylt
MDRIVIKGGHRLSGEVQVEGAKNAVLPVLTASLLATEGTSKLINVPKLSDVETINNVLSTLNADVSYDIAGNAVTVDATATLNEEAPYEYVSKMRASILVMGPLLARLGHAIVALPGGCAIGSRPIEQHIKGFEALGADIHLENGNIYANAKNGLQGANIHLDFPSVGATQNIIMAASLANGKSVIENAAKEPEIVDLANYINEMGGRITGAGTDTITIHGVNKLTGVVHSIIPDRIEAGTMIIAGAITRGDVYVRGAIKEHMTSLVYKLEEMGVQLAFDEEGVRVTAPDTLQPVDVKTLPHPGFPTDMQSQMMALLLTAEGHKVITETVFENRFMHVAEFRRMNANITVEGRNAKIEGKSELQGAQVKATDLRAAAALILAGLVADGTTQVTELKHLDRGYVNFHGKLKELGADIQRINA